jgi:electron transport complex protein RnfB
MSNGRGGGFRAPIGGRGRQPGGFGLGPGGNCVCPKCGHTVVHQRGTPCFNLKCPKCGTPMTRG